MKVFLIEFTKNLENGTQNGIPIYFQTLKIFKFVVEIEPNFYFKFEKFKV